MLTVTGGNILLDVNLILSKIQVSDNMKLGDFGCGSSGHFVFPVADLLNKKGKSGKIYAVDILRTVLETIRRKAKQENYKNIEIIWSDLEIFGATKIESCSIDFGFLLNTLYQSRNRIEILREVARMLKKNAKLLIVDWKDSDLPLGPPKNERVKEDMLKAACAKLGLKLDEEFIPGPHHFGLIFTKL